MVPCRLVHSLSRGVPKEASTKLRRGDNTACPVTRFVLQLLWLAVQVHLPRRVCTVLCTHYFRTPNGRRKHRVLSSSYYITRSFLFLGELLVTHRRFLVGILNTCVEAQSLAGSQSFLANVLPGNVCAFDYKRVVFSTTLCCVPNGESYLRYLTFAVVIKRSVYRYSLYFMLTMDYGCRCQACFPRSVCTHAKNKASLEDENAYQSPPLLLPQTANKYRKSQHFAGKNVFVVAPLCHEVKPTTMVLRRHKIEFRAAIRKLIRYTRMKRKLLKKQYTAHSDRYRVASLAEDRR
uniref:60S ribosomal protein L36 n=1 Tax=Steinernema glaseri TaxID=37863 RepID=A0A1I7YBC0_9BILA